MAKIHYLLLDKYYLKFKDIYSPTSQAARDCLVVGEI